MITRLRGVLGITIVATAGLLTVSCGDRNSDNSNTATTADAEQSTRSLPKRRGVLQPQQVVSSPYLMDVTSVAISPDGRFLYAASYALSRITIYQRDEDSGQLKMVETISQPNLNGAAAFRLDTTGRYGVAPAFNSRAVTLFKVDENTGLLEETDSISHGQRGAADLEFAIEAAFSVDSKFIYVGGTSAITVFRITENDQLEVVETFTSRGVSSVRGLAVSPDNKQLYAANQNSHSLMVLDRDEQTGTLESKQLLIDERDGIMKLGGVFFVTCSADGKHVYASAGRFHGDNAVSVFKRTATGELELVQELARGRDMTQFMGGNEIAISPDGGLVVALATMSDTAVTFARDLETGRLTVKKELSIGSLSKPGAAGIAFSPDGRHCYVADEKSGEIAVFDHE